MQSGLREYVYPRSSREEALNDWLVGQLGMLGLLGAEGKLKNSLKVKGGSSVKKALRPACSWSPALAQDQLLWDPDEGGYNQRKCVVLPRKKRKEGANPYSK